MRNRKFYITSSAAGDDYWNPTNAKTLRGAKAIASRTYQPAVGGKIEIAEKIGDNETGHYERLAVKHGFNAWQDAI